MTSLRRRRLLLASPGLLALAGWCGFESGYGLSSRGAETCWAVSLGFVVACDAWWWRRAGPSHPVRRAGGAGRFVLWELLFVVVVAWEILGIDTGPHTPHLTVSALSVAFRPLRAALLLVWLLVGLGYGAVRARARERNGPSGGARGACTLSGVVSLPLGAKYFSPLALLLPASRAAGVSFWLCWIGACLGADLAARRYPARLATAEETLRLLSRPWPARVAMVTAWAYAGWHLFVH